MLPKQLAWGSKCSTASEGAGYPPSVGFLISVVQRLEALLFLLLAEARGVGHFEKGRRKLYQPARVNGGHLPHVLLGGQHQLVVHDPVDKKGERLHGYCTISFPAGRLRIRIFQTNKIISKYSTSIPMSLLKGMN